MARVLNTGDLILPTLMDLVIIQEQTRHFEDAIASYCEINDRKDSLFTQEKSKIIANANAPFDFKKKRSE